MGHDFLYIFRKNKNVFFFWKHRTMTTTKFSISKTIVHVFLWKLILAVFQDFFSLFTSAVLAKKKESYPRPDNIFFITFFCKYEFPIVRSAKKSNKKKSSLFWRQIWTDFGIKRRYRPNLTAHPPTGSKLTAHPPNSLHTFWPRCTTPTYCTPS